MRRSKKLLIYKLACVLFGAILLFVPQRGLPYSDIRVLATVLGIDGGNGRVSVSAQLAVPVSQGSDGKASTVAKATGGSIGEALENLEIGLGRYINYGHLSTVAIGNNVMLTDLNMMLGYLISSGKAGPGTFLVHCPRSTAAEFLDGAQSMGESSDAELGSFIAHSKSGNHVSTTTILRFLQTMFSTSHAAYMPCVALENENMQDTGENGVGSGRTDKSEEQQSNDRRNRESGPSDGEEQGQSEQQGQEKQGQEKSQGNSGQKSEQKQGAGGSGKSGSGDEEESGQSGSGGEDGEGSQKKKLVAANSITVFGGDESGPVELDPLTTRGIVWQDKYSDYGLVELRNLQLDGSDVKVAASRLTGKKVRMKAAVVAGENVFTYSVKLKLRLDDSQICSNPEFYTKWKDTLEKEYESAVKSNLLHTVAVSKELGVDFLGLREYFHKFCRKGYENFDLQTVAVNVNVKAIIQT